MTWPLIQRGNVLRRPWATGNAVPQARREGDPDARDDDEEDFDENDSW